MDGYVHPDFAPVSERLRHMLADRRTAGGAAVAVFHRGELVVDVWGGARDAAGHPWERDTMATSFSTTKGVVATVVHRLVDRGELDYDDPVAEHWPEFAEGGKDQITIRHLLSHTAALHAVRPLVRTADDLLDWDAMVAKVAAAHPAWTPGRRSGYHAFTFGWLLGEVIRRITGLTVDQAVQREVAEPLGLDGMSIGLPRDRRGRDADLLIDDRAERRFQRVVDLVGRSGRYQPFIDALYIDDMIGFFRSPRLLDGEIPAINGLFTARDLARMYAALATPDAFAGPPFLTRPTLAEATTTQTTGRDIVVGIPMRWRLGYHLAGTTRGVLPNGFGHFGFGGSGAWGDPDSGLAVAMVLNDVAGTPFGDTRMLRIGAAAVASAARR